MHDEIKTFHPTKKFYFLDYFYVLLQSLLKANAKENVFEIFKNLKGKYQLGESKYKKLTVDDNIVLSPTQINRYKYTFEQVINESEEYNLIKKDSDNLLFLTEKGRELLTIHSTDGTIAFNLYLFKYMENKYNAFKYLVSFLYKNNTNRLVFPHYSPRQLKIPRKSIVKTKDIFNYLDFLKERLEVDIRTFLKKEISLDKNNMVLKDKLLENILPRELEEPFDPKKYNAIIKRCQDFWTSYFLRDVYGYKYSMSAFDIWSYRAKQIGIVNITEFYPNFSGKIIYPVSIVVDNATSTDFKSIFEYRDNLKLYLHEPSVDKDKNQEMFMSYLVNAYFDIKKSVRSYFVNLASVKEIVCFNFRVSEHMFAKYLDKIYTIHLSGDLGIRISLEVDKLPEETKAMYLKREPVMVAGKPRNIIAIDVTRKDIHE